MGCSVSAGKDFTGGEIDDIKFDEITSETLASEKV